MFKNFPSFLKTFSQKIQGGFRKGYNTQQCLLVMLKKLKRSLESGKAFGSLLKDLSKVFDSVTHELLISNLNSYGFGLRPLRSLHDYLSHQTHITKVNNSYCELLAVIFGVPKSSILGPLLFKIFLADLFYRYSDINFAKFEDDNIPNLSAKM